MHAIAYCILRAADDFAHPLFADAFGLKRPHRGFAR
jgi:hypothetical protein